MMFTKLTFLTFIYNHSNNSLVFQNYLEHFDLL